MAEDVQGEAVKALLAACPTASAESLMVDDTDGPYIWVGNLAVHLVDGMARGETSEVAAALAVAESLLDGGNPEVANLIQVGFFEGLQNVARGRHSRNIRQEDFEQFLGPRSMAAWLEVNFMWGGSTSTDE